MKIQSVIFLSLLAAVILFFQACLVDETNLPPTALFTVNPSSGSTQTVFLFDASASTDPEEPSSQLRVRWDFNGDGVWDTEWIYEKTYSIQFIDEFVYNAKLEVADVQGLTSQSMLSVTVNNGGGGGVGTITDPRDGQTYTTEMIGSQTWLSENLKYQSRGTWCYDNDPANCTLYGPLYDWDAAMNACPPGWHLPSNEEWEQLELNLGMSQSEVDTEWGWRGTDQGKQLKSTTGWIDGGNGSNSSGFNGLPAGSLNNWGEFENITHFGSWWTSTEVGPHHAWMRGLSGLSSHKDKVSRGDGMKVYGRSVRCVKD